ncbi:hypothetical protein LTR67_000743 [Exophiala xenobiotica]
MSDEEDDEDYHLPLQDQRVFGAGIKRKRIAFVPASSTESSLPLTTTKPPTSDIASRYLSIVLPKDSQSPFLSPSQTPPPGRSSSAPPGSASTSTDPTICSVCHQPIVASVTDKHESSLAHQVCLTHVHPPSHLDRSHVGLRYLTTHGWDPDSRLGLGARQEGIRIPVKPKEKHDTEGLRESLPDDSRAIIKKKATPRRKEDKVVKLNAKQVRIQDTEAKRRADRLRQSFYGPDLDKYLGLNS